MSSDSYFFFLYTVCPKISDDITVNTTDRSPNTVVFARCGNEHNSIVTTCQVDGDWNPKLQLNCGNFAFYLKRA